MSPVIISRTIDAPIDRVFRVISEPEQFQQAVPHITNVEFLTASRSGVGTRFKETRLMHGRESSVELEVLEYAHNDRIRLVSDAGGTVWDSLFTVSEENGKVTLHLQMDIRPHTLMARLTTPIFKGMVAKGVEADMDVIKEYCESPSQ